MTGRNPLAAILGVAILCAVGVQTGMALSCYSCYSSGSYSNGTACEDVPVTGQLTTVNCSGVCYKIKTVTTVTFIVSATTTGYERGCYLTSMASKCSDTSLDVIIGNAKVTSCYCNTNLCNVASATAAPAIAAMLTAAGSLVTALI